MGVTRNYIQNFTVKSYSYGGNKKLHSKFHRKIVLLWGYKKLHSKFHRKILFLWG